MNRARLTAALLTTCAIGVVAAPTVSAASKPTPPPGTKKATTFIGTPAVGALFDSAKSKTHFCTASVVTSPKGDVLITAAHCVQGTTKGWSFAPGFHGGVAPYGRWTVTGAYLDPQWLKNQNPHRDYAFLTVAPRTIGGTPIEIQSVTGSDRLGTAAHKGESVTVPAYPHGTNNDPITCTAPVYFAQGVYPAFNCNPYVDGTSGSPWLVQTPNGPEVVGLVAGLHQGGCETWTSYSPPLGSHALATYKRAVDGGKPDVAPQAGSDGCSTGL
jgi:V8-like Glu-specific endopeptidase